MSTTVKFLRKIEDAREFEVAALRDVKDQIFPFGTLDQIRTGYLSAHYLEDGANGDPSKLAVLFRTGEFIDIAYPMIGGIYAYGGFIPAENLEKLTLTDTVTEGYREFEAVYAGEVVRLAFDPASKMYAPTISLSASDAVLAAFHERKAA